ncbi:hypothetical protein N7G274_010403 [Stereocaulon virgatum]|uniref:Uncharacterized protein n=1 Tax=Stereocaulon virgatum TaxID=373712 RepID=A0ABR3ZTM4_9LECA
MVFDSLLLDNEGKKWLDCSNESLKLFLTYPSHHELMQFSGGRDVELRTGEEPERWGNERDRTLIEALLIQSRGSKNRAACGRCVRGLGPFEGCRSVGGWFDGVCGNCKRGGNGMACTLNKEGRALSGELESGIAKDWRPKSDRGPGKREITIPERFGSA